MSGILNFASPLTQGMEWVQTAQLKVMGVPFFDPQAVWHLSLRFGFHLLMCLLIIHFCYYPRTRNRDYYKSFVFFASGMFLLLFLLESIKLQIGLTLGLFAIFGVIRYRTETVPIKEMTYLFMIIVVSVINGLSLNVCFVELLMANVLLFAIMYVFEHQRSISRTNTKLILYERIELIVPERRKELLEDVTLRTGLNVTKVEVGHIDFLRDAAFLKIHYLSDEQEDSAFGKITKLRP